MILVLLFILVMLLFKLLVPGLLVLLVLEILMPVLLMLMGICCAGVTMLAGIYACTAATGNEKAG
jgi:hypothetical protein